jgi:Transcriptional regulatory protein, C terminal
MRTESAFSHSDERVQITAVARIAGLAYEINGDERLDFNRVSQLGLDEYRIALIPPERCSSGNGTGRQGDVTSRMLVLSLTWKQFRKSQLSPEQNSAVFGDIHIDFDGMEVRRANLVVSLTAMEFRVLKFFVSNPRRAISRDALLNQVWGYNNYPYSRTVDNHIMRLRQKLEPDVSRPVHFQTVHGIGYKFVP